MPTKELTQAIVETVGPGTRLSVSFNDLLGWSVGRHGLLSDHDAHSFRFQATKSSA